MSWFYDWGHDQVSLTPSRTAVAQNASCQSIGPGHLVDGAEYVPMIFSKFALANISRINTTFLQGARYVFGYNEPDHSGTYLKPKDGADRWIHMEQLADAYNLTLVAPCVSNYASGEWWLHEFNQECNASFGRPCRFDHMCVHTYFEPAQVGAMFDALDRMHRDYGKPIWVNEFACPPYKNCSAADELRFAKLVVPRLEATPYIYRYAWFQARLSNAKGKGGCSLLGANASTVRRTVLGDWYNAA